MISCPSCNTECSENANFCPHCGSSLNSLPNKNPQHEMDSTISNVHLTQALKRLMPTSYVEKLLSSKGKMEGERRVVTILFSDVKGSTALAENLDPEEVLEVMNGAFNILIEPIARYEGTLARLMGDAILAFFGAPIAHEDDPYRACRAALDILEGAKNFTKKLEIERGIKGFGVRVGINTGLVVVAEVGTDLRVEYTAMGDAVNVAARMESSAKPGTILITEATKKLIQNDFELLPIGPIQVKGKSRSINTYRVLGVKNRANIFQETTKFRYPLIGRGSELKKINDALGELQNGTGSIISITGDRGIGKSRLIAEVRNKKPIGLKWAEGRTLSYTTNNSYWMARSLMRNYFGFYQETCDKPLLETMQKRVESHFGNMADEIYPYLEYFLKDSINDKETKFDDLRAVKGQFHFALKEFIKKESLLQPIVLVWEDLQWCDLSSIELLNELLPLVVEYPLLLLFQYRLDENESRVWNFHHNNLNEYEEIHKIISLRPLGEAESILLIENLTGNINLSLEIQNQLIQKSEGNPTFLEELIISILEQSDSVLEYHSSENMNLKSELQFPDSLQNVIMSRVDRLEQLDKIVLHTASVIGRVFPKKLLANVLRDSFTESEFECSLNKLQLREFILRHLPSNLSSNTSIIPKEYIFKQDLAQFVLYNSLLLSQRQSLHRKIGEEFENLYSDNLTEIVDSLAHHFEKGKDFTKAIRYYKNAADKAKDFFANEDAIFFYSKALDLSGAVQTGPLLLAQIHESMGDVYSLTSEYSKSINHFTSTLSYQNDIILQAISYYKCGRVFERWGKYRKGLENYNKALTLINQNEENILAAHIYSGIGMVYYRQENLIEAQKLIEKAFSILNEFGSDKDIADVYNNMGIIYSKLGQLDNSLGFHKKSLKIREKFGVSSSLAASYNNIGYLHQQRDDLKTSIEYYTKSLECCEKTGNLHGLARTYDNLSHIYLTLGKNDLAMNYNLKAVALLGKISDSGSQINPDVWLQSGVW